ncbi:MAG: enoyl-CoA hydratase/isomerase family protein [Pseudomonadota bacterium]
MDKLWPAYRHIAAEQRDNIALITLQRPDAANALSSATVQELSDALAVVNREQALRALVLTGSGDKVFCAGADLKERRANPGKDWELRRPLLKFWNDLYLLPKPLVIAVNGHAAGGGFELLMLADAVVASEKAEFWLPEIQWGGIPGGWGTQLLPRLVGPVLARWIILSGKHVTARDLLQYGLATHCVAPEQVLDCALDAARQLAERPAAAVACAKEALRHALSTALATGVEFEDRLLQIATASPERQAGLERFAQGKRA